MPGTKYERAYASGAALNTAIGSRTSTAGAAPDFAVGDLVGVGAATGATEPPHAAAQTANHCQVTRTPK
jgi:hypothetical protein